MERVTHRVWIKRLHLSKFGYLACCILRIDACCTDVPILACQIWFSIYVTVLSQFLWLRAPHKLQQAFPRTASLLDALPPSSIATRLLAGAPRPICAPGAPYCCSP